MICILGCKLCGSIIIFFLYIYFLLLFININTGKIFPFSGELSDGSLGLMSEWPTWRPLACDGRLFCARRFIDSGNVFDTLRYLTHTHTETMRYQTRYALRAPTFHFRFTPTKWILISFIKNPTCPLLYINLEKI